MKNLLAFLLLAIYCPVSAQSFSNDEVKKQADKLFEEEDYSKAYKLYSQLVANFPKDPVYNFKLGVCMIYAEPDKKKSLPFLKFAAAAPPDKELKDARFYLGKAYHINYYFDEAIRNYNDYKLTASSAQQKKLQVDREIKACSNGKHLLSNLTDLEVLNKTELPENDYFRNYKKAGGKLLVKPDDFKTSTDKKKKEKSVIFLPARSNVVYFSSYGDNSENGRDIYTTTKGPDGTFGKPEKVKGINTEFDEDYPFLHPDGKTLYFASKGYNSMGGYDIFKSVLNESTNTWGTPVNLEFPINSPDDDFLYVTDSLETIAYFTTGRQSPPGKVDVLKIKTARKPIDIIALKGKVIQGSPEYSLKSTISVQDVFSHNELGTFNSEDDGSYTMEVPNGSKLLFTVETPGVETQSAQVSMPMASASRPYRQTISYDKGKLKILNYFDEVNTDNTYLQYLNVIEKKAKLEVNEGSNTSEPLATNTGSTQETPKETSSVPEPKKTEPLAVPTPAATADPQKGMDNAELAKMAREDADELRQEAGQLSRDYAAANETALKQKAEADKKMTEANEAIAKAEAISDETERKAALENANALKQAAEKDQIIASKIMDLARSLDEDAKHKRKEAELNSNYAKELEKSIKTKDNGSAAKMEGLQKEITELAAKKKESDGVITEIKNNVDAKEKQIASAEEINTATKTNLEEIKTAISEKETELSSTKKKSAKKTIVAEIEELKTEQTEKEQQIADADNQIKTLNTELGALKNELDVATKIRSDLDASKPAAEPVNEIVTEKSLKEKYKDRIAVNDITNAPGIEESNKQLINYNKDLDQLISKNKTALTKTKNKDSKLKLTNEIKTLETTKKQNQLAIASNTKKLDELSKAPVKEPVKTTFDPITAANATEAINKLDQLNTQLAGNDNENFDYNGYQNPQAQNLKVEADARINDAIAKQKKLKDEIALSREDIQKNGALPAVSVEELNQQGEELQASAQKIRKEAGSKKGAEKEKLLEEAKKQEEQANQKHIEAADVIGRDNSLIVSANQENIQNLLKENTAGDTDKEAAKALNEEAKVAFRKAADIRTEGNSLTNAGGKLGSYSNAEEKEAEAISKQQQAIAILMKSNPSFQLKVPVTSTSSAAVPDAGSANVNLGPKLETVNTGLADLAAIKIESYGKLYEANQAELDQLLSDIRDNQSVLDNTPSLKTEFIAGNNKVESAKGLKQNADNATNPNEKLSNLIASIKKQNEGIKQLSAVNTTIAQSAVVTKPAPVSETPPAKEDPVPETTNLPAVTETEKPAKKEDELSMLAQIDTEKTDLSQLAQTDTTAEQVINYLNTNSSSLKNSQANTLVKNSLSQLKNYKAQGAALNSNEPLGTPAELNAKSDALLTEAEDISTRSADLKQQAQSKEGEEKNYLLAQARELEIEGQDKTIQASDYRKDANEREYKANLEAIDELTEKLKVENPDLAGDIESRKNELTPLKNQVANLRSEANALNSKAAKIGALSNAEEKELELMQKQSQLLNDLKKQYPDYVMKPVIQMSPEAQAAIVEQKKSELREKEFTELTNLTNAFSLEYESSKNSVPQNLSEGDQAIKRNADELNMESKKLLIKASQEKNPNEKTKLLTLAVKSGNAALEKLNKLLPKSAVAKNDLNELEAIGNQIIDSNEEPERSKPVSVRAGRGSFKIDGLEVVPGNAYSNAAPIPMDAGMESGLVFRVQIGAFKTRLPNNAFKGLSPLNGETTSSGYFRYTAGNFKKIENANAVKNDLRNLGYSDAFVVVYYNGKRITLAEALAQMEKDGKSVDPNAPQTAGITANANVPKAAVNTAIQENVVVTKELEQTDALLYTVQIGVYTKQITKPQLLNLRPIFREQLNNGLYRYTAGIYNNSDKIAADKNKVVDLGIKDAFVAAYINGKRLPFAEAKAKQAADAGMRVEPENPIIFPERPNTAPSAFDNLFNTTTVEPFKNSVSNYPSPTPENGVKTNEAGVSYKVQIGAFSKQVPADVAAKFSSIKTWPVDNKKINGLYIYNIGNFSEAKFAKELKDEALKLGITDAFITVYRDGKKLYGPEAESYLR